MADKDARPRRKPGSEKDISPEAAARVRVEMERLLRNRFHGVKTHLAEAIGVTQPAVTKNLQGGGIARTTAIAVAKLSGVDVTALLGEEDLVLAVVGRFPNLELCIQYHAAHGRTWPKPVVLAARGGWFRDDVSPEEWARRLDVMAVQQAKHAGTHGEGNGAA